MTDHGEVMKLLHRMAALQAHGGPDGEGFWLHPEKPLGLLHRRLAIIDLSPAGAQPMQRAHLIITYNGEIYNYAELKRTLEQKSYVFHSASDTEVLLWGWHQWGSDLLPRLRGMWAFGLWDGEALYLVRDRFGVKPLFYAVIGERVFFASELPALLAALPHKPSPAPSLLPMYLAYGFVRSPFTFYEGIYQVPPGSYLRITENRIEEQRWWDPKPFFLGTKRSLPDDTVEEALLRSFQRRLVADVPVGLFLSGGIDSSLVAALLSRRAGVNIPTFTIGFTDKAYDEAPYAQQIAQHLGLPSHVLYIESSDLLQSIERLPQIFGQPFGDASALAVDVLAGFARASVKVALSADGGDELFGGYVRQRESILRLWLAAALLRLLPLSPARLARFFPTGRFHNLPAKLFKLYHFRGQHYGELVQAFPEILARTLLKEPLSPSPYIPEDIPWRSISARQYLDLTLYLPDDVLQKVDRATMAHALEAREPFLDPELVEIGGQLPDSEKVSKRILRRLLGRYLPAELWERPKQGFAPPLPAWLNGPLRSEINALIHDAESPLYALGLRQTALQRLYHAFLSGEKGLSLFFWHLLILGRWAYWYETFRS